MKKGVGFSGPEWYKQLYGALEDSEGEKGDEMRECVMEDIQDLLNACYWLGANPLRELRRILPMYEWRFHSSRDRGLHNKIILQSDFIWRANWVHDYNDDGELELVTATKQGIPPRRLRYFWAGDLSKSREMLDFVKGFRVNPIYWDFIS